MPAARVPPLGDEHHRELAAGVRSLFEYAHLRDVIVARRAFHLAMLAALQLLDVLTTALVLERGGSESNPALRPIVEHPAATLGVKMAIFLLVLLATLRCPVRSRSAQRMLGASVLFYAAVVGWNLTNLIVFT